ncbi:TPR-like protein [Coprinopsis marcescibilis]|uniref:TPR-like protein n=1 Tax=Coprinopsis marcescibilis TaxID=230819 RepID=A0A5C3KQP2_COPMA|nr:TPR-like protein [Coprinopsis marcescibilis]
MSALSETSDHGDLNAVNNHHNQSIGPDESNTTANSLDELAAEFAEGGRLNLAIDSANRAIQIRRALAQDNSFESKSNLANSLHSLSTYLAEAQRWDDAVEVIEQSIHIRRKLADDSRHVSVRGALASSLHRMGSYVNNLGYYNLSLQALQEAVSIRRQLVDLDVPKYHLQEADLAASLHSLASTFSSLDRLDEAVKVMEEAVQRHRRVSKSAEAAPLVSAGEIQSTIFKCKDDLAECLHDLAVYLSRQEQFQHALFACQEAIVIRRSLLRSRLASPHAHNPINSAMSASTVFPSDPNFNLSSDPQLLSLYTNLASSLDNASIYHCTSGRLDAAIDSIQQTIDIRRRLASSIDPNSGLFYFRLGQLGNSLYRLSTYLANLECWKDSLGAIQEVVDIRRRLVTVNDASSSTPGQYSTCTSKPDLVNLSRSLFDLATCLAQLEDYAEAAEIMEECVRVNRRVVLLLLSSSEPEADLELPGAEADLASSSRLLSIYQGEVGKVEDAIINLEDAIEIYRRQVPAAGAALSNDATTEVKALRHLAESLKEFASFLGRVGRYPEAVAAGEEAASNYRRLIPPNRTLATRVSPAEATLASTLHLLADDLSKLSRCHDAISVIQQAIDIRHRQVSEISYVQDDADDTASTLQMDLSSSIHNLAIYYSVIGRYDDAIGTMRQAVDIRRRLVMFHDSATADEFEGGLLDSLLNLADCYHRRFTDAGRDDSAHPPLGVSAAQEAVDVSRGLLADVVAENEDEDNKKANAAPRPTVDLEAQLARALYQLAVGLGARAKVEAEHSNGKVWRSRSLVAVKEAVAIYGRLKV